uniref:Uncharacterized protein n=1 Tax=Panagrellus redivivus TaxID=6233 RepID=A0A7E4W1E8_PANRE
MSTSIPRPKSIPVPRSVPMSASARGPRSAPASVSAKASFCLIASSKNTPAFFTASSDGEASSEHGPVSKGPRSPRIRTCHSQSSTTSRFSTLTAASIRP